MFTTLIPRKIKKGRGETLAAYQCQELYCISRYNSKESKLTYTKFFEDIEKYAEKVNFDIERNKEGKINLPKSKAYKNWPVKYNWKENYEIYEEFMNGTAQADFQKMYIKNMRTTGMSLIDIKVNLIHAIHKISTMELPALLKNTYLLAKLTETLTLINGLIQNDIEFGKDETAPEENTYMEPVDLESDEFMESELEYLEKLIERK